MDKQKGGSVNISDAFESYGRCRNTYHWRTRLKLLYVEQVHLPSEKLVTKSDSTLFATLAQVQVPVAECIPRTLWAPLLRLVSLIYWSQATLIDPQVLGISLPYSSSTPAAYPRKEIYILFVFCVWCLFRSIEKVQECVRAAAYLKKLLELDLKPRFVNPNYFDECIH
jgi:hypothetical protein